MKGFFGRVVVTLLVVGLLLALAPAAFGQETEGRDTDGNLRWTREINTASAEFGYYVDSGDINGDGYSDVITSTPLLNGGQGGVWVYFGSAIGPAKLPNWQKLGTPDNRWIGRAIAAGDFNNDGYDDLAIGINSGNVGPGRVEVYYGSPSGLSLEPGFTAYGIVDSSFGSEVAAGDVNGDGFADLFIGAYGFIDDNGNMVGAVYMFSGTAAGIDPLPHWAAFGEHPQEGFGASIAIVNDVSGDGFDEVALGLVSFERGPNDRPGKVDIYYGGVDGPGPTPNWSAIGEQTYSSFGAQISGAGDVNGDGFGDLVVGANYFDGGQTDEGKVYMYYGSPSGLRTNPAWAREGNLAYGWFGHAVAGIGDIDGDGYDDIAVGAPYYSFSDQDSREGRLTILYGAARPREIRAWNIKGDQPGGYLGWAVSAGGNVNGDGFADFIAGAVYYDHGESNEGRIYIYAGRPR